jgi:hypothetical protein
MWLERKFSQMASAAAPQQSGAESWALAFRVLGELLAANDGVVSSMALRRELEGNHSIPNARDLVIELKFFDPEASVERGIPAPSFKFHHLGRSFYSEQKYAEELQKQQELATKQADVASNEVSVVEPDEPSASRTNRQEEARLVTYVKGALEDLYSSEANSEENSYVFDVHSHRKGSTFENTDLIAVHWRSERVCDLVTVEVKLEFISQVVQQALSYTRFSHRVWLAVPVDTDSHSELREKNPALFEYAISQGLGILACRKRKGRSYEVFPIHWPLRNSVDPLEEEEFLERYRPEFEAAGVVEPKGRKRPPRLR